MKRNLIVAAALVVLIAALVWAGFTNHRRRVMEEAKVRQAQMQLIPSGDKGGPADDEGAPPDLRGKQAPDFKLKTLDGKTVSLADLKGKPVLVNFWATWCAPCKIEMPWFEEFRQKYESQGFTIVGIVEDDAPKEAVQGLVEKTGVKYTIAHTDNKVDKAYGGIDYLPASYFVGRDGVIIAQSSGLGSKDEMEANVKKIVAGGGM